MDRRQVVAQRGRGRLLDDVGGRADEIGQGCAALGAHRVDQISGLGADFSHGPCLPVVPDAFADLEAKAGAGGHAAVLTSITVEALVSGRSRSTTTVPNHRQDSRALRTWGAGQPPWSFTSC